MTVEFGEAIDFQTNELVLAFAVAVERATIPGVMEVVPTYRSATIYFDLLLTDAATVTAQLRLLLETASPETEHTRTTHRIPVCYGAELGPDLIDVAERTGLTPSDVITLHTSVVYHVYMLGFSPGFPYLGTVPDRIVVPRLPTPRKRVAAGSVGIAGSQTGIYPQASPGGWRIIGRTPVRIFDLTRSQPFLVAAGDQVQFIPIDMEEFRNLSSDYT
ncbi:MAG: 5-oxoprolinase subunit PxpB [Nitrospira defluvii]|nr:5-oxoprolinase subunit PxpB [Nitrospira defluvii]